MSWFDEFAKALGKGMSRREAMRLFAGGLAAVGGVGLGAGQAAAQRALRQACTRTCRMYGSTAECVDACVACSGGMTIAGGLLCPGDDGLYCCNPTVTGACPTVTPTTCPVGPF